MAILQELQQIADEHIIGAQTAGNEYAICFHSQLAAERYLKIFLASKGQDVPQTNNISELIEQCAALDPDFFQFEQFAEVLSLFDVEIKSEPSPDEAKEMCTSTWGAMLKIIECVKQKTDA